MIKLIGIAVVAIGFVLRVNTLLVVLAAGVATGLVAGMSLNDVIAQFGTLFVENRTITLVVVIMLPLIGMLERHGLQERAEILIRRMRAATAGRVLLVYSAARQIAISLGVRIGDHAVTVRPLIAPMAVAAARARHGELPESVVASIRAHAAAADNVGNFFGEDIFVTVGAVVLMNGFFETAGINVSIWHLALWGLPTAVVAFGLMVWRTRSLDRKIAAATTRNGGAP